LYLRGNLPILISISSACFAVPDVAPFAVAVGDLGVFALGAAGLPRERARALALRACSAALLAAALAASA